LIFVHLLLRRSVHHHLFVQLCLKRSFENDIFKSESRMGLAFLFRFIVGGEVQLRQAK
jgi:hypothetical protein